ncbi:hydroxyacylglutathione hydrolase [Oxalobacteraceae bacterium CAVE-383]|nr:hydroxyacylglutathione hydrolase [Oxalobacteraceae bacterium CAVE-383]
MPALLNDSLRVLAVPAFKDNYLWLIHNGVTAAAVDPGDAAPILDALAQHKLTLAAILLTHHHADHVGGVPRLLQHTKVPVYGPRNDAIGAVTVPLAEGDLVDLPALPLQLSVLDVPGHTRGHIAYVAQEAGWLFCGDTLFAGGCGRLFEGTPAQMMRSLQKLGALPPSMQVYCAHEYTMANLRFAIAAEPDNAALRQRIADDQAKRDRGQPTVPSTIGLERETNPFLRHQTGGVVKTLRERGLAANATPVEAFAALREWKNNF